MFYSIKNPKPNEFPENADKFLSLSEPGFTGFC